VWRIALRLSLAAVALFGITLIPEILDKAEPWRPPSFDSSSRYMIASTSLLLPDLMEATGGRSPGRTPG